MPLSEAERSLLSGAATDPDPTRRRQAVATLLSKHGADETKARELLSKGFLAVTLPSFHLIPQGDAMASQHDFVSAYEALAVATSNFTQVDKATLTAAVLVTPRALIPLRMIAGLTQKELAASMKLVDADAKVSDARIKNFERSPVPDPIPAKRAAQREALASLAVETIRAVLDRQILTVPQEAAANFHSKIDREDTRQGWSSVSSSAINGVPYSSLLYHRYVGGAWRQVQDAYSEVKGDNVLELPLEKLLTDEKIPYYRRERRV
jgi:hypothetical protein